MNTLEARCQAALATYRALDPHADEALVAARLANGWSPNVWVATSLHQHETVGRLPTLDTAAPVLVINYVTAQPDSLPDVTALLLLDADQELVTYAARRQIAERTRDPHVLDELADSPSFVVAAQVADNRHTRPGTLRRIANSGEYLARAKTAANPRTPVDVANRLASDPDETVRAHAVYHPQLDRRILDQLAHDPDETVRAAYAACRRARRAHLEQLAGDTHLTVRRNVAAHWRTPVPIRKKLAIDAALHTERFAPARRRP